MALASLLARREIGVAEERFGLSDLAQWISIAGQGGSFPALNTTFGTISSNIEGMGNSFALYASRLFAANPVVYACIAVRMSVFSQARFRFRDLLTRDLSAGSELEILEHPWPNGTTSDLLAWAELYASLAGNAFFARPMIGGVRSDRIYRLQPDRVGIVLGVEPGSDPAYASHVVGYTYHDVSGRKVAGFQADEVAHYAPRPDPMACWRGMSWLSPVIDEVAGDDLATAHKRKFFTNAATPNLVVSLDKAIGPAAFEEFVAKMRTQHEGVANAYRTLYLGAGADAKVVGANFEQADFANVQAAGETRIAAAAEVPPIIAGFAKGLESASYSNYGQARRRFADGTIRPLWQNVSASLSTIVDGPSDAELWWTEADVAFVREDAKDLAEIHQTQANTIRTLTDAGYDPNSVIDAVTSGDMTRLRNTHSGLFSVQLQKPGSSNGAQMKEGATK